MEPALKNKTKKKLLLEGLLALLIALSPFVIYFHKYLEPGAKEINFLFITVGSNGFEDASYYLYYLASKLVPLMLLVIWFVTSKQWWYHAILIPIAMYSFQLFSVLTYESNQIDENEILYVIGVTMVVVPIVYFIRIKLVDKHIHGIDLKAMDEELQLLKAKEELRKEREKLEALKKTL